MTVASAASNPSTVTVSKDGQKGPRGTDGTNGVGFNSVRDSLLNNPLCHLFKKNKISQVSAPTSTDADVTIARATTATHFDRYGVLVSDAVNELREEYEGWLFEGASTNLILYSDQYNVAAWIETNAGAVTATPSASTKAGMTFASVTTTLDTTGIEQSGIVVSGAGVVVTASFCIDTVSSSVVQNFHRISGGGLNERIIIDNDDWLNPTLSGVGSISYKELAEGVVRYSITFTTLTADPIIITSFIKNGDTIYEGTYQVEELPFPSSYISTTATATTRAGDNVSIASNNNMPKFDFYISLNIEPLGITTSNNYVLNNPANDLAVLLPSTSITATFGDASISGVSRPAGMFSLVYTGDSTGAELYIDGVSEGVTAMTASATLGSLIYIGSRTATQPFYGHISDLRIGESLLNASESLYLRGV